MASALADFDIGQHRNVVLLSVAFAFTLAAGLVYVLAKNDVITLDGQAQGILSILVIGAATDYALLLVARYREELHRFDNPALAGVELDPLHPLAIKGTAALGRAQLAAQAHAGPPHHASQNLWTASPGGRPARV